KQYQSSGGAVGTDLIQAHVLQDVCNGVTQLGGRSQRQVHDAEGNSQALSGHVAHQLTSAGDLKGCLLNLFCNLIQRCTGEVAQRAVYNAGARDTDGDDAVWLFNAVESTCHKWVIA